MKTTTLSSHNMREFGFTGTLQLAENWTVTLWGCQQVTEEVQTTIAVGVCEMIVACQLMRKPMSSLFKETNERTVNLPPGYGFNGGEAQTVWNVTEKRVDVMAWTIF